jgi:hypothetical protein
MLLPQSNHQVFLRIASITILLAMAATRPLSFAAATPKLVCSPTGLNFGRVTLKHEQTQLVELKNNGSTSATLSAINVSGSEFSVSGSKLPVILESGARVALYITFAPKFTGRVQRKVTFTSDASDPSLVLTVMGTGVEKMLVTASPTSLSFGQVATGTRAKLAVTLTNKCKCEQTLSGFQTRGSEFSLSDPATPLKLDPGQSVKLDVTFAPNAAGLSGGSFFISGPSLNVPLSGTGTTIGRLSITPGSLNFGSVLVGVSDTQTASLRAMGGSVTIFSAASSASQFAFAGASFPLTIAAGRAAELKVAFTPQKAGSASGTLLFSSNAKNGVVTELLAGTGKAPQVSLSWNASTSSEVSGYNIYRRLATGGSYSKVNSSLDPDTWFTDTAVVPGRTYQYVTTAVTSCGQESAYSNQIEVEIP